MSQDRKEQKLTNLIKNNLHEEENTVTGSLRILSYKKLVSIVPSFIFFQNWNQEKKKRSSGGVISKCILKKLRVTKKNYVKLQATNTIPHTYSICEDLITSFLILVHSWSTFRSFVLMFLKGKHRPFLGLTLYHHIHKTIKLRRSECACVRNIPCLYGLTVGPEYNTQG